jgi:choline dehydrogenase-like flavoprotein
MIVDAQSLPQQHTVDVDVCIIGGGAAGISLVRALAASGLRIALFEGGGFEFSAESQALYAADVIGHSYTPLDRDRLRYLGGSTNHWSGSCRPFQGSDLDGWPYGPTALAPYYQQAHAICQLGPYTYEPADWASADARPLDLQSGTQLQNGIFQYSPPTRFGTAYRELLASSAHVTVYLNANVIGIETGAGGNAVTGLKVACFNGLRFQARARHYVLAAGGIENARLLLAGNASHPAGLGNEHDLVGRYFMDHAFVPGAATVMADPARPEMRFYDQRAVRGQVVEGYISATDDTRRREQLPAFAIGMRSASATTAEFQEFTLPEGLRRHLSDATANTLAFYVARVMGRVEGSWDWMYNKLWSAPPGSFTSFYICGPEPDPASRVTLADDVDSLGMRRVRLDWRLPGDFEAKMRRAHELLGAELGRLGVGRLRIESAATGHDPMQDLGHGHHHMGTTRMHANPRQGVVDEHCRVHSLGNLFVAGSSVFPSYACDDPTMTIVALALKLADRLKTLSA